MDYYSLTTLTEALSSYLQRPGLLHHEKRWISSLLTKSQERIPKTLIPNPDETAVKLRHITTIFHLYTGPANDFRPFLYWHLGCLFYLSETELRDLCCSDMATINTFMKDSYPFICQVLRGNTEVPFDLQSPDGKGKEAYRCMHSYKIPRRDGGRCIITGKRNATDLCQIIPYSGFATAIDDKTRQRRWHVATRMFGRQRADALDALLKGPGCTEHSWNFLPLSKDMNHQWNTDQFSLEPLPLSNTTVFDTTVKIRVRFHWFLNISGTRHRYLADVTPGKDAVDIMFENLLLEDSVADTNEVNIRTGQPVYSGNIYEIDCEEGDGSRMFEALQLRWDLQRVMLMAGVSGMSTDALFMPPEEQDWMRQEFIDERFEECPRCN